MQKNLLVLLLLCWIPASQAQLLDPHQTLGTLNTVTRQVEATAEATAEQVRRKAERELEEVKPGLDQLANTTNTLVDPLVKLPQQLPILNRAGQTALVEVQVENGWRAVQGEWLLSLDDNELASLQKLPVEIIEKNHFAELDMTLVRFRAPPALDSPEALKKLLPAAMASRLDRNHIYSPQTTSTAASVSATATPPAERTQSLCGDPVKIGMIDTALNLDHPAFAAAMANQQVVTQNFLQAQLAEPDAHGTAVAGLLVGQGDHLVPLAPRASLYAASVFYARNDYAQGATMMNLVRALNWLMTEKVSVINMSLAGPDNQILARAVAKTLAQGKAIVAAVGNEGPAAPAMFPAAYPGVIAATAVDRDRNIYRWANRGAQVYFAAPGVSVTTARSGGGYGRESGTSLAAPVISAFVACELVHQPNLSAALASLQAAAMDLGEPGRDPVFGYGLLSPMH